MPAKKKVAQDGGWGLTYADVGQALREHEAQHGCTIEFGVAYYQKVRTREVFVWEVTAHARWRRGRPDEVRGFGSCTVGYGSGAASFPGAYLRALIDACDDLERRRTSPAKAPEMARLPGF